MLRELGFAFICLNISKISVSLASTLKVLINLVALRLSYGTGRPAVLKDDESIRGCVHFLDHPLATEDDKRLVSTVELISIRERVHNALSPLEGPVRPEHFEELHRADIDFKHWYSSWDVAFSTKYEDAGRYFVLTCHNIFWT